MTTGSSREIRKEERTLTKPSSKAKIAVAASANPAVPATAAEPAKVAEKDREASNKTEKKTTKFQEATEIETVHEAVLKQVKEPKPMIGAEPMVEPEIDASPQNVIEVSPEPVKEPEAAMETNPESAVETSTAPAVEQAATTAPPLQVEPEPAPAPVAVPVPAAQAGPRRVLKPQRSEEEKASARLAARQKKLDEGSEESPFSVIVGQVYDGPMDLLLDLIRKQDIDIYDIPIAIITSQFLAYVNQLRASDVDVAGDFIYTASLLIHIKSKMLLPHTETGPEQAAEDPRRELVERLLEHERFKNAAQMLLEKQMLEAATWTNPGAREFKDDVSAEPEIAADTVDLVRIFRDILERARNRPVIDVEEDSVTVGQMIQFLARRLTLEDKPVALRRLLSHTHSERALIAMFLALLEMVRLQAILLRQDRQFSEIFIKKHSGFETVMNEGLGNARDDWR
jgi:segregation and condensation protein A